MFPILNLLVALPWRLIGIGVLASVLFVGGCQYGERRITAQWDADKAANARAVVKQAEQVAAVTIQQSTINQEISNDFQKSKAALAAERGYVLDRAVPAIARRVRGDSAESGADAVPEVPGPSDRIVAATADAVPHAGQPEGVISCEKLAEDAAQTTLMLIEFQRWHQEQAKEFSSVD